MQRYKNDAQIQNFGEWLSGMNWTHYATFTTSYELTLKSARRAMHRVHDFLDKEQNTAMFWAAEPFDLKDGFHTHALLNTQISYDRIIEAWQIVSKAKNSEKKWHRIDLQEYNPERGAGYYLSKYISKRLSDYDLFLTRTSRGYS